MKNVAKKEDCFIPFVGESFNGAFPYKWRRLSYLCLYGALGSVLVMLLAVFMARNTGVDEVFQSATMVIFASFALFFIIAAFIIQMVCDRRTGY